MRELIQPAVVLFLALTLITGVAYPLVVTGLAQAAYPEQANGSMITADGKLTVDATAADGSGLIGQPFDRPDYFWSRLSATGPVPYNAAASSGSNLGPLNPALAEAVTARVQQLLAADPTAQLPVPVDLVTASGSGLDPNISPAAALYQAPRVAAARNMDLAKVTELVKQHTTGRSFGLLGESRVNVLRLNLALDRLTQPAPSTEE